MVLTFPDPPDRLAAQAPQPGRARARRAAALLALAALGACSAGAPPVAHSSLILPPPVLPAVLLTGVADEPRDVEAGLRRCDPGRGAPDFDFRASVWLNLHNVLFRDARLRMGQRDATLGARGNVAEDTAAVRRLTAAERRRWDDAVDFYVRVVAPDTLGDSLVVRINGQLALADESETLDGLALHDGLREVLHAVAPLYREVWWPAHERRNRRWIEEVSARFAAHGVCAARRLAAALDTSWASTPIRVDATVYASWFGAYTTLHPPHVTISSTAMGSQGTLGLEVLLHEAGHSLLPRVERALDAEAVRRGRRLPRELAHLLLFHATGTVMRESFPGYTPYAEEFGIWRRNDAARGYRGLLERSWAPALTGTGTVLEAVERVVNSLPRSGRAIAGA